MRVSSVSVTNTQGHLSSRMVAGAHPAGQVRAKASVWSLSFIGLVVYLWVVHSAKAPLGAAAIAVGLVGLLLQSHRIRIPASLIWFGGFLAWAAIGSLTAVHTAVTTERLIEFAKLWLIFLVACNVAGHRRQLYLLIIAWLAIYALYPVRGTAFNVMIGHQYFGRYAWNFIFENPNDLAALTLPVFAMAVALLQGNTTRGWIRLSALGGVVILPLLVLFTQSRGGLLALGTMALLILVEYRERFRTYALAALVGGVVALAAPPEVWTRLGGVTRAVDTERLDEVDAEGSAEQRYEIWRVAARITADHPVSGIGLGSYSMVHAEYAAAGAFKATARGPRDTHSIYLNVLAETGFPGLFLFLGMVGATLVQGRRVVRTLRKSDPAAARQISTLLIGLIGLLQAGLFATLHTVALPYVYLGIVASAIAILPARPAVLPSQHLERARRVPAALVERRPA